VGKGKETPIPSHGGKKRSCEKEKEKCQLSKTKKRGGKKKGGRDPTSPSNKKKKRGGKKMVEGKK